MNDEKSNVGMTISELNGELFIYYGSNRKSKTSAFFREVSECKFIDINTNKRSLSQLQDENDLKELGNSFEKYKSNITSKFTKRMAGNAIGHIKNDILNEEKERTRIIVESIFNEKGNLQEPLIKKIQTTLKSDLKVLSENRINDENVRFDIAIEHRKSKKVIVICELKFLKPGDSAINRFKIRCSIGQILEYGFKTTGSKDSIEHWLIFNQLDQESLSTLKQIISTYSLPITVWTFSKNNLKRVLGNSFILPSNEY